MGVEIDDFDSKDHTKMNRSLNSFPTTTHVLAVPTSSNNLSPIAENGTEDPTHSTDEFKPIRNHLIEQGISTVSENMHRDPNPNPSAPDIDAITEDESAPKFPNTGFINPLTDHPYASESELPPSYEEAKNMINPKIIPNGISTNAKEKSSKAQISTKNRKYCQTITGVFFDGQHYRCSTIFRAPRVVNTSQRPDYVERECNKEAKKTMLANELFVVFTIMLTLIFAAFGIWMIVKNSKH